MTQKCGINGKRLLGCHYNKRLMGFSDGDKLMYQEIVKLATGTDITLTDTKNDLGRITGFECATVQNGTPDPNNPVPMKSTGDGGIVNVLSHGKNMFNPANMEQGGFNYRTGINYNYASSIRETIYNVKPNTQYVLSCNESLGEGAVCCFDKNNNTLDGYGSMTINNHWAFTTKPNTSFIKIRLGSTTYPKIISGSYNIQLEEGLLTPYEPYTGADYPITLPEGYVGGSLPNGVKDTDTMQYMKSITFSGQSVTIPDMKSNGSFRSTRGGTLVDKTITLASVPSGTTTVQYELETPIPITLALPLINTYSGYNKIECLNAVKPNLTVKYLEK